MDEILGLIFGLAVIFLGLFSLVNRAKIAKLLQPGYDRAKNRYDVRTAKAKGLGKLFRFLFFKPRTYYMTEGDTEKVFLLVAPLLILLGMISLLLSLGVINY